MNESNCLSWVCAIESRECTCEVDDFLPPARKMLFGTFGVKELGRRAFRG